MKSFDDFLSTLSAKDKNETFALIQSKLQESGETFSEKELKLAMLVAQIDAISMRQILRQYHEWLSEQMR